MPSDRRSSPRHESSRALSSEAWERLEQIRLRFESAWRRGLQPRIEDYLAVLDDDRRALVAELAHEDLVFRLRAGQPACVEDYLGRFPELRANSAWAVEAIAAEYRLRQERGGSPALEEYFARFPNHAVALRQRIDQEAPAAAPPLDPASNPQRTDSATLSPTAAPATYDLPTQGPATLLGPIAAAPHPECVVVAGYDVLERIGKGGMGVVYKARQIALDRIVALKMILHGEHADREERERFHTEARAVARLQHANIVQVYEVGECQGLPYFSMEFCPGGSLADKLKGAPWEPLPAAALVKALADAMHAAHQHGIVHRDLKPANVLLGEDGTPKVTDFGLARRVGQSGQTRTGAVMGTPSYMAPEQAAGKGKEAGPAADVYALGTILYELLTGRPPFRAATDVDTLMAVVCDEPLAVRRLQPRTPRDLETICQKCLFKDPQRRYASAAALAEDLRRFAAGEAILARPTGHIERAVKWVKRRPAVAALLATVAVVTTAGVAGITVEYRQAIRRLNESREAQRQRVLAQVEQLRTAAPAAVPGILTDLEPERTAVLPRLRELWEQDESPAERGRRMRVGLALLPVDSEAVKGPLAAWMLLADDPREMLLARDALEPYAAEFNRDLWQRAAEKSASADERFRALVALAAFDPHGDGWKTHAASAAEGLLAANPLFLGIWAEALEPVRTVLVGPLSEVFRGRNLPERRRVAANVLATYVADEPLTLAELAADADAEQWAVLRPLLEPYRGDRQVIDLLERALAPASGSEAERVAHAPRQANAAAVLLWLGHAEAVWPLWRHTPTPDVRSHLLQRLHTHGIDDAVVLRRLEKESDMSARRALILALGEYTAEQLPDHERARLVPRLVEWYLTDPDPGIHGAIDWLLRHAKDGPQPRKLDWGQAQVLERIDYNLMSKPPGKRLWHVNGQGQTMVLVGGRVEFLMGSPPDEPGRDEDEVQHRRRLDRHYALAAKPVTVAQFQRFLHANPQVRHADTSRYSPQPDCPAVSVTWYEAAQYCRWLSEQEGVPKDQMCYPPVEVIEQSKDGRTPLRLPPDYLSRTGYRLPTEAEWEYACRAGAVTAYAYGGSAALLDRYGWNLQNAGDRTWPVGQKRPNDLGIFDMHGNAWEWCQESAADYDPAGMDDKEDLREITDQTSRALRGGAFNDPPRESRAAFRNLNRPSSRLVTFGLRPARTAR
jgi:formylglycine-generating enzyme required for sulfatase activity/tRNA A-37 threonylcarbamoyl transferase component Bud32